MQKYEPTVIFSYKVCKLSSKTDFFIYQSFYSFFFSNVNVISFKIVPLGSYTPMETLFPLLVAVLEVFNWYGLQHVCYEKNKCFNLLDRIVNEQDLFSRVITGSHRVFNKILRPIGNVRRGTL